MTLFKNHQIIAVIALTISAFGSARASNITYTVDLTAGTSTTTGTITTDGTIGTIYASDIVSFDLFLATTTSSWVDEISSAVSGTLTESDTANFFQATSSELTYQGDSATTGYELFANGGYTPAFLCLQSKGCYGSSSGYRMYSVTTGDLEDQNEPGLFVVGSTGAGAPEPGSVLLMLGGLGFVARSRFARKARR